MKGKHGSSKSKLPTIIISVVVIALVITGAYLVLINKDQTKTNIKYKTIEGQVVNTGDQIIRVRLDNNHEYLLSTVKTTINGGKLLAGNSVTIKYTGKLDDNNSDIQSAKVGIITQKKTKISNLTSYNYPSQSMQQILDSMSLEEKVSQMFMVRCPDSDQVSFVNDYQPGGYILFGQDFENKSKQTVINNIQSYQNASKVKMFIGTDEEGGTVSRLKSLPGGSNFQSPQAIYTSGGMEAIKKDTKNKAVYMKGLGLNLNFAPVCDISTNPNDFIYNRSFGKNANQTAEYVSSVVQTNNDNQMGSVLKHFPGYGNNGDSHTDVIKDNRSLSNFKNSDFIPFKAGIEKNANSVLVAHNILEAVDPDNPSSLSKKVHNILRNDMNYQGVIMTDDLLMEGVRKLDSDENIAIRAVQAGNDILLSSDASVQIQAVIDACNNGTISINQIDRSVLRILAYKQYLNII